MAAGRVITMAAVVALALLVLVLGCVIDDNWWSMLTVLCYLVATISWALTQQCGAQPPVGSPQQANAYHAYVAGLLMAIGWWCLIHATVYNSCQTASDNWCNLSNEVFARCHGGDPPRTARKFHFAMYLPAISATLGMMMTNCFNYGAYTDLRAKSLNNCWIFFSYLFLFIAVLASAWSLIDYWLVENSCTVWPGAASLLQTICLLLSASSLFFGNYGSTQSGLGGQGLCGGGLFEQWGCVFTTFGLISSFGFSLVMWQTNLLQRSFYSTNLAGLVLCTAVMFVVKEGAITRTHSRRLPMMDNHNAGF